MDRGLVRNFSTYFNPLYAATRHQRRFSYTIRYQVYAEELGWEPLNEKRLERDECDDYAHHCSVGTQKGPGISLVACAWSYHRPAITTPACPFNSLT